ncbi:MAG TPA: hypothetical protein VM101_11290 [Flavitalea sp.]|nr:hypothetical protein [Flavitalea sp.]
MTDVALEDLPQDPEDFAETAFVLPQHPKAKSLTPYDYIVITGTYTGMNLLAFATFRI